MTPPPDSPPRAHVRPVVTWATVAVMAATAFAVSVDGAASPLHAVGLVAIKSPVLAVGALLCAGVCAWSWRRRTLGLTWFELAVLSYLVAGALSVAMNRPALPFLSPWLALNFTALVMVAAGSEASRQDRAQLLDGLLVVGVVLAALTIYESAGGFIPWDVGRRPGATFGNRNAVGGFCAILIPIAIVRLWTRPTYLRGGALAVLLLSVLLCRARSAWMGLMVTGALYFLWQIKRRGPRSDAPRPARRAQLVALGAVLAAVAALQLTPWIGLQWKESSPILSSFSRMLESQTGTGRSRVDQHLVGITMLAERPLIGLGPGAWRQDAPRFVHQATGYHTGFIDALWTPASDLVRQAVEFGVIGLCAAASMLAALLLGARARIAAADDRVPLALAASLIVAVVISAFDALLYRPPSLALIAVIAGALRNEGKRLSYRVPPCLGMASLGICGTLCVAALVPRYLAMQAYQRSFSAQTVIALADGQFLPAEALMAVRDARGKADCTVLRKAATLVDRYLPYEPENLEVLAACAVERGHPDEAARLLERALRVEPHDEAAARELVRLRTDAARPASQ
jgi:hypothetical protein